MAAAEGGRWAEWEGRTRTVTDRISLAQARALAATLDRDPASLDSGSVLPHGWHWIYFNDAVPRSRLAEDGHEARGDFLPPVPLARRMWAGGRIRFHAPLRIGDDVVRTSTIEHVTPKEGRTGALVFVTVSHRIDGREGLAVHEEQDLVYRGAPADGVAAGAGPRSKVEAPEGSRRVASFVADPVTLFRFSALTFNGHRIHYDHPYATQVEGYPGLVVHGPLVALLLLEAGGGVLAAAGRGSAPGSFRYRAVGPLFCGEPFDLVTSPDAEEAGTRPEAAGAGPPSVRLWAVHAGRGVAMEATVDAGPRATPA